MHKTDKIPAVTELTTTEMDFKTLHHSDMFKWQYNKG
jgi:hypothetical protein